MVSKQLKARKSTDNALAIKRKRSPCSKETEGKSVDVNISPCICISVR